MQPEDPKSEFQPPEPATYYAAAKPPEADSESSVPETPTTDVEQEESDTQPSDELESNPETEAAPTPLPDMEPVSWRAAEYIHHEKNSLWYVAFGLIVVAIMAVSIFARAWTFVVLAPVMATALLLYTRRPAQQISYVLSGKGLYINDLLHPFGEFKSFGVLRDDQEYSIMLIPARRFRPGVSVYFPEESGEAIVDLLGARLPMQELHLDAFDRVIRLLRI